MATILNAIYAFFSFLSKATRYLWERRLILLGKAETENEIGKANAQKISDGIAARDSVSDELPSDDKYCRD